MSKILSSAQKLQKIAQLKKLPQQILPSTLKYNIKLPNIKKISIEYRSQCKDIGPTFQFLRKYTADIKFHNPNIQIQRIRTANGPIKMKFTVYQHNNEEPILIDPTISKNLDELKSQIQQLGGAKVVI